VKRYPFSARVRYAFDNFMSRGTVALILGLFGLTLLVIVAVAAFIVFSGTVRDDPSTQNIDFPEALWMSLLRTLDPGTMGSDTGSVAFVLSMFAVTLGGIFIVAILIGIISNGIEGKLAELRKGRSRVLEEGHTVILGWSAQIFDIIGEIVTANENKRRQRIVVLAERDKVEMEDDIKARVPDTKTTRIVCRTGSPIEVSDLAIASVTSARAIIVLAPEIEDPDAEVVKTLLAVTSDAMLPDTAGHSIVAELRDTRNVAVARLASRDRAQLVLGGELIGRIAAQTCRQPGLSVVYMDLLDFAGDEMYFWAEPSLAGTAFGDALHEYRTSCLIGIAPLEGDPVLNPPPDRVIAADDRLIFISEDDDTIHRAERPADMPRDDLIVLRDPAPPRPDNTLVLGWNSRTPGLLTELDRYVSADSRLMVIAQGPGVGDEVEAVGRRLHNMRLTHRSADTTDRDVLEDATAEDYDHVVVMSYSDLLDAQRADARTLVTLLHLRDIEMRRGEAFTIVSEMLDVRNRDLANVTRADDFIVSNKLVSLAMSQLAENPALRAVFDDLFDEEGSEVYLKPAADYVALGKPVDFYTVVESARRRSEVAIGYRSMAEANDPNHNYGVVMNPDKALTYEFTDVDRVIVLAEN
jgi:voltage-gated potassium channel Kch